MRGEDPIMTTSRDSQHEIEQRYEEVYQQYAKPLEAEHAGEYLAVSPRGETLLGPSLGEVARLATARFGRGNFVFKLGERAVGKWR